MFLWCLPNVWGSVATWSCQRIESVNTPENYSWVEELTTTHFKKNISKAPSASLRVQMSIFQNSNFWRVLSFWFIFKTRSLWDPLSPLHIDFFQQPRISRCFAPTGECSQPPGAATDSWRSISVCNWYCDGRHNWRLQPLYMFYCACMNWLLS